MRVLVVGASGLVGWNCVQEFRQRGWEVVGTYGQHPLPGLVPLDLADPAAIDSLLAREHPEAVVNCAAWSWVDGCENDPARAFACNRDQPAALATAAHRIGARFVHFSTSYVFDGEQGPYDEAAPPHPISVYGQAKLAGEVAVQAATERDSLIIRTMGVYGPEPQRKNFVYQVVDKLRRGERMRVPLDQFGNASYAPDLACGLAHLLERKEAGLWNLAGPEPDLRRDEFALRIATAYELDASLFDFVPTAALAQPAPRPRHAGLAIEKAILALPWQPRLGIRRLPLE